MDKTCFVIQGFGKKQDYEQGKQFDLDASYSVIKEAVEAAGVTCFRGDELSKAGAIDQVMYDQLLAADLVLADITTLNFNAAFELGVRLALRPYSTLIIGEEGINFPFDINHIYIHTYKHLGEDIGNQEAQRLRKELTRLVQQVVDAQQKDSPVYTYIQQLPEEGFISVASQLRSANTVKAGGVSLRKLKDQAKDAMSNSNFVDAIALWQEARKLSGKDDFIIQQLALATYKSKKPDVKSALIKGKELLELLQPELSYDSETLGLWAAVHKRLFELDNSEESLKQALFALERGFFIMRDYYNGINLAFMLDVKASLSDDDVRSDLQGTARYVRRIVLDVCKKALKDVSLSDDEKYWILATGYEASTGLELEDEIQNWKEASERAAKADWMKESTEQQIANLRALINS